MNAARRLLYVCAQPCPAGLESLLRQRHWDVVPARSLKAARHELKRQRYLVALLTLDSIPRELVPDFEACREACDDCEWVGVLPPGALDVAALRELVVRHFFDHHTHPADPQFLCQSLGHAFGRALLRAMPAHGATTEDLGLVGRSAALTQLRRQLRKAAAAEPPVLVEGESGTGKDLVARALHACSARRDGPLVVLDGAVLQEQPHDIFESAAGGTLVLDHVAEMPLDWQARLLRFMAEQTVLRAKLGRDDLRDVRIVALSEGPLAEAVAAQRFRQDLSFRLDVVPLHVPPLRERKEDIPALVHHFHAQGVRQCASGARGFSREAMAALMQHSWPGNVRELQNRVHRAVLLAERRIAGPADLGLQASAPQPPDSLEAMRIQAERDAIATSLDRASHNISLAARELGVSRMTMYRLMAKHRIAPRTLEKS
ncbi:MAG: sigma-54-dependent Fis family transcriptional regulator [Burkholderiales bacterium]|nr:sigma-54-dependent Fis family transcriptional regulator [Burkholderiales bacterium]